MMKRGAISILTTMLLGLAAWAGTAIIENRVNISELKTGGKYMHQDVRDIKADVKILLRRVRR